MELIRKEGNLTYLFLNITPYTIAELDKVVRADVGVSYRMRDHGNTNAVITIENSVEIGIPQALDNAMFLRLYDNLMYISFDRNAEVINIFAKV